MTLGAAEERPSPYHDRMNGLAVFALIAGGLLVALCVLIYVRDRGRAVDPRRERTHVEGTWGGGDRNPYGGENREGPHPPHGQISGPGSGGGN